MAVTYIVDGIRVDPNGKPVNPKDPTPHSWIPTVVSAEFDPSPGEIAAAAAAGAPHPGDFDRDEDYRVAVQEHEADVAQGLRRHRMHEAGLNPDTGQPRQLTLPETDEPVGTSEAPGGKSEAQTTENTGEPAKPAKPETKAEKEAREKAEAEAAKNQG